MIVYWSLFVFAFYIRVVKLKKYASYSGFFCGYLRQFPLSPAGDLKNPSGTLAGPRGFSNPLWASGDLGEDPLGKTRITYIYFFQLYIGISRGLVYVYPLGDWCTYIPQRFSLRGISVRSPRGFGDPLGDLSEIAWDVYFSSFFVR